MKLHKPARSWYRQLELRRQVAAAVDQHRRPPLLEERVFEGLACSRPGLLQARIFPLDEQGKTGPSSQIEIRDLDQRSITFRHAQPLHARRALVVLEGLNLSPIAAEVDLSWCRFSQSGEYTSGGRFVQLVGRSA